MQAPLSIFSDASAPAARVATLTWFMVATATVVFVGVVGFMLVAVRRNRARDAQRVELTNPGTGLVLYGGLVMPAVVLTATIAAAFVAMGATRRTRPALTIDVIAYQWWWAVRYDTDAPDGATMTANEIHIPAGQPVRLRMTSADVIHSFWVPRLQGKIDLIPGTTTELDLAARAPGRYMGECAEFCGVEHARMRLVVVADDSATFRAWLAHERTPAAPPADSVAVAGARLFATGTCATCHAVRGTAADGGDAPDLTHVGSRLTLGAGVLPNTLGNLAGWIANAQAVKPGAHMPAMTQYSGEELRAVARYVRGLR